CRTRWCRTRWCRTGWCRTRCRTRWCRTRWCRTRWCKTRWCRTRCCRTRWCRTRWCRTSWCRTRSRWCRTRWCRTRWCRTRWCRTRWCRTRWCRSGWCRTRCSPRSVSSVPLLHQRPAALLSPTLKGMQTHMKRGPLVLKISRLCSSHFLPSYLSLDAIRMLVGCLPCQHMHTNTHWVVERLTNCCCTLCSLGRL
uniref:Uncharacterized protein n=1 Tax=Poecilia latipinna TaxID=48699 RepID=A0A3B3UMZ8_9TELE